MSNGIELLCVLDYTGMLCIVHHYKVIHLREFEAIILYFFSYSGRMFSISFHLEEFEDTKGIIRIHKSKKNSQHNGQMKKYKRTNNDLQNITLKIKDRVTQT
jgi:hypothetical protein